jgi:hypothetical protein
MDSISPRITAKCKKCFSTIGRLTGPSEGKTHISGVRCDNCQTFIKWLSKEEASGLDLEAADWLEAKWVKPDSQVNLL